ncbi:MAG TPA: flagellar M-ring protein FliF [Planctomycetes bacterium]|nr:flagellar M-ring protein FliF [Planctomycetota bacterium]
MSKFWQQLMQIWSRLEVAQKATIVLAALGGIALVGVLGWGASQPSYQLLARDLTRAKSAEIASFLEQQSIPYKVVDRDTAVLVPSQHIYRLRNELAQQDMLGEAGKGFELLDTGGFMESTFREHRTYDRAVAGELERSFREIPGVRSARVIIDRPQPSPFIADDEGKPRASIKLDVGKGTKLSERQVAGIIALTAGAVAGLDHDRVEVMDNGGLLTPKQADTGAALAQNTLEAEMARESYLTRRAQEQLDVILGPGRGQVRVSVKLDFAKRSTSSVDPTKSAAMTEKTTTTDKKTPVASAGGLAGASPNTGDENRPAASTTQLASETQEEAQTAYFVGQKKETIEDEVGRIRGMTVSILLPFKDAEVDELDAKGKPTGKKVKSRVAYPPEEQKRFESLVLSAIGFESAKDIVAKLGDSTNIGSRFSSTVQSMDLYQAPVEAVAQAGVALPIALPGNISDLVGYGLVGLVAIVLLVVARGQLKRSHQAWLAAEAKSREVDDAHKAKHKIDEPEVDPEEEIKQAVKGRRNELKENIKKAVVEDPNAAAQIVKRWLYEQG